MTLSGQCDIKEANVDVQVDFPTQAIRMLRTKKVFNMQFIHVII